MVYTDLIHFFKKRNKNHGLYVLISLKNNVVNLPSTCKWKQYTVFAFLLYSQPACFFTANLSIIQMNNGNEKHFNEFFFIYLNHLHSPQSMNISFFTLMEVHAKLKALKVLISHSKRKYWNWMINTIPMKKRSLVFVRIIKIDSNFRWIDVTHSTSYCSQFSIHKFFFPRLAFTMRYFSIFVYFNFTDNEKTQFS